MSKILDKLKSLTEDEFIDSVIVPIAKELHPGRIEYTHSTIEAGRDLVSFGKDTLGREHILCLQAKSRHISYGKDFQQYVVSQTTLAKREGVTLENGNKTTPHEVWFLNTYPFPETNRRQVADSLKELDRQSIKFIAGDELGELLYSKFPSIVASLLVESQRELDEYARKLNNHKESRAFNLAEDRKLEDFFVDITLCPSSHTVNQVLSKRIVFKDLTAEVQVDASLLNSKNPTAKKICELLVEDSRYLDVNLLRDFVKTFKLSLSYRLLDDDSIGDKEPRKGTRATILLDIDILEAVTPLVRSIEANLKKCSPKLSECLPLIKTLIVDLQRLDLFLYYYKEIDDSDELIPVVDDEADDNSVVLFVDSVLNIVGLSDSILIEGIPGIGKTTILRKISSTLLSSGEKVVFVPCFQISSEEEYESITQLLEINSYFKVPTSWKPEEMILVFDGLDETSVNITSLLLREQLTFKKVIVSTRTAYETLLRPKYNTIFLTPLSKESRDLFFEKWFANDEIKLKEAKDVCSKYSDVDIHSRVPLIATVLASLVEHDYQPRTRLEIYDSRLELLLWKWDQNRGVSRFKIDNPDAKRRFLERLGYEVHNMFERGRLFGKEVMLGIFADTLGNFGYRIDFDDFVDDLVINSGLIIEEMPNQYSFGHLTFQEHLAGRYLERKKSVPEVAELLSYDWWTEPLAFYSAIKGDISTLIEFLIDNERLIANQEIVQRLLIDAPYTSAGAVDLMYKGGDLLGVEYFTDDIEYSEED